MIRGSVRLMCAWVGVEQSITHEGIEQWHKRLHARIRATKGHTEYSPLRKLAKTLLTVRNEVKI